MKETDIGKGAKWIEGDGNDMPVLYLSDSTEMTDKSELEYRFVLNLLMKKSMKWWTKQIANSKFNHLSFAGIVESVNDDGSYIEGGDGKPFLMALAYNPDDSAVKQKLIAGNAPAILARAMQITLQMHNVLQNKDKSQFQVKLMEEMQLERNPLFLLGMDEHHSIYYFKDNLSPTSLPVGLNLLTKLLATTDFTGYLTIMMR